MDVASGKSGMRSGYGSVEALAASPDGKLLASSGHNGLIQLWDTATGADACPLLGHKYAVWGVALDAKGAGGVTAAWDDTVRGLDATTGAEQRRSWCATASGG